MDNSNLTKEILLVIAHPDDESMFFIPVLLHFQQSVKWHLLCLSSGNFNGLGSTRIQELRKCWRFLGFDVSKLIVHEDSILQVRTFFISTP